MATIFDEDWTSYSVGEAPHIYPSRLGGLWFKDSIFTGHVIDDPVLYQAKAFQFDVTGQMAWWDEVNSRTSGALIMQVKGGLSTGGSFKLFVLNDAQVPLGPPFPFPVQLFAAYFESDNTISVRSPSPENAIMANSGFPQTASTPLGTITTTPFAFKTDTWYIIQFNFSMSVDLSGHIVLSGVIHVDKNPVLAFNYTSSVLAASLPNGTPPTFNYLQVQTCKNNTGYLAHIILDSSSSLTPGDGANAFGKVTQGVAEVLGDPSTAGAARVTQGAIELPTFPDNFARVTQAVIEILATTVTAIKRKWRIYEA